MDLEEEDEYHVLILLTVFNTLTRLPFGAR